MTQINNTSYTPRPINMPSGGMGSVNQPPASTSKPPVGGVPVMVTAGQLPTVQDARANVVQQQSSNEGLFGCIKAGLASFKAAISSIFAKPPAPPSPSVQMPQSVSVSVNGQTVNIMREQFEPMIMSLPESQRQAAVTNLQQTLSQRVRDGLRLMDTVLTSPTPPPLPPPSNGQVAAVGLALYALANQQGDTFTNGSFSVADPDGRLAKWLDSSPDVYIRSSTHLKAYQHAWVDGHRNMQRGIDIPEGVDTGLPNGHRTMLYGTIPERTQPDGTIVPRRLFVKTESAGCRISTASLNPVGISKATSTGMTIRSVHLSDISEMFSHLISWGGSRGLQGIASARKEHFPKAVNDAYKGAVKALSKIPGGKAVVKILENRAPTEGGGMCVLRDNIAHFKDEVAHNRFSFADPAQQKAITDILDQLEQALDSHRPQESANLRKIRLGNEVIIDYQPGQPAQTNQPVAPPPPPPVPPRPTAPPPPPRI